MIRDWIWAAVQVVGFGVSVGYGVGVGLGLATKLASEVALGMEPFALVPGAWQSRRQCREMRLF